ncbi:cold-shock protein [Sediminitomix flava]|uniref:Putative cold-shock DNA-binding protein n=1 Tax=Sediminitomix flava TaxID=379075 RepID=A0A315ZI77_SEDFL|nr:cold shock domain-containing protein [Sediminitomix flava]PWJ44923.1 putative cold-shock DNA-binding protein [Sediminitomix flava]
MAKSQATFSKMEKEKKRQKKKQEKLKRKEERQANSGGSDLDSMMAYVDEFGNIVDTPPEPSEREEINVEDIAISIPKAEEIEEDPVKKGRVEFFNDQKGFGFIKEIGTQEKYFVHVKGLIDDVRERDLVTFELEEGLKGLNAVRVKKSK